MERTGQNRQMRSDWEHRPTRATGRYALFGAVFGLLFPLFSILFTLLRAGFTPTPSSLVWAHRDAPLLYVIDSAPLFLGLFAAVAGRRQDRLIALNHRLQTETEQLKALQAELDRRVTERTGELMAHTGELERTSRQNQSRAERLAATVEVSRRISTILDPDELIHQVPRLIAEHYDYYHAGVFLLDESAGWANLRATNSEGGQRMLARGHRLRVGEQGIVGYATRTGRPRLALDVGSDAIYFDNPDLPETRSEIALPLTARYQILGALDIQSREIDAFDEQDVAILKVLAEHVAIALDNARLMEASQAALKQAEETQQAYLRQGWRRYAGSRRGVSLFGNRRPPVEHVTAWQASTQQAVESGATFVAAGADDGKRIIAPIKIRDQIIGALGLSDADDGPAWSKDQVEFVETVADQLGQALESARLFEEAQRRAEREQLISQIDAKLRSVDDVDGILRVAIQEMRRALGVSHGAIRLGTETHLVPSLDEKGGQIP